MLPFDSKQKSRTCIAFTTLKIEEHKIYTHSSHHNMFTNLYSILFQGHGGIMVLFAFTFVNITSIYPHIILATSHCSCLHNTIIRHLLGSWISLLLDSFNLNAMLKNIDLNKSSKQSYMLVKHQCVHWPMVVSSQHNYILIKYAR